MTPQRPEDDHFSQKVAVRKFAMLRIVQLDHAESGRAVAAVDGSDLRLLAAGYSVFEIASSAIQTKRTLRGSIERLISDQRIDYEEVYEGRSAWRLLPPIDHPEPARCLVTGTGLTHKGSADNRQQMHASEGGDSLSDSLKMFQIGLEGGRPAAGSIGAAPEWFYKGAGNILRAHNEPLNVPTHGLDGGEEAEIAGVYIIADDGMPFRIGLAQANEFSDHVLEAQNYLYLAPSKLRECSLGPELVVSAAFDDIVGRTTIMRNGEVIWEARQASGERWMCHSLANLEHHHFKYAQHRRPGDIHVHFFGADMFSFKDRLRLTDGDVVTISFNGFGRPLRNPIRLSGSPQQIVAVKQL